MGNFMFILNRFVFVIFLSVALLWVPLSAAQSIDANTATAAELQRIKGIGEKTAERILEERERGGYFESVDDFALRVKGLGSKRAAKMVESGLVFSHAVASQQSQIEQSVVAKEISEIKKRFKYVPSASTSEAYLIKPK
jgi:competence protein ComEA